jgi:hypothetical protein
MQLAKRRARQRVVHRVEPELNALGDFLDAFMLLDEKARVARRFAPHFESQINALIRNVLHGEAPRIASEIITVVKTRVTSVPAQPREDLHDIFEFHDDDDSD